MASLFGALGSLAESYGLARQQLQENALAQIRERTEQRYADIAEQRLAEEREQLKQQQQESAFRQKEFAFRQKQYENNFIDLGTPMYTDPVTKQRMKRLFNVFTGEHKDFGVPGTGNITPETIKQYISGARKEDQPELTRLADMEVQRNPDDPGKAFDAVEARRRQLEDAAAKAGAKKTDTTKVKTELSNLKVAIAGLKNSLGVLDSWSSRGRLIGAGAGQLPPKEGTGALGAVVGMALQGAKSVAKGNLTDEEWNYDIQLTRAMEAVQAMRSFTGLPRSVTQTIQNLYQQLPDPTTPSSDRGRQQIALLEESIRAIERGLTEETAGTGTSATPETAPGTAPGTAPNLNNLLTPDVLNKLFGGSSPSPTRP